MTEPVVLLDVDGPVATVTLNRPASRNAISGELLARQLSFTGDFLSADQALTARMVSEVVPHADLLTRAREIAAAIAGNDAQAVRALLASYRQTEAEVVGGGYAVAAIGSGHVQVNASGFGGQNASLVLGPLNHREANGGRLRVGV